MVEFTSLGHHGLNKFTRGMLMKKGANPEELHLMGAAGKNESVRIEGGAPHVVPTEKMGLGSEPMSRIASRTVTLHHIQGGLREFGE